MSIMNSTKLRSEPSFSSNPPRDSSQPSIPRSSLKLRLPNLSSRSPAMSKSDRQLFNSHFSHLPAGAVVMFPANIKEQEGCIKYFAKNVYDRVDRSVPGKREAYDTIKKSMGYEEVERLVENSKRTQSNILNASKKRGSMYLSEFWTKKQVLKVIKTSELDKAYDASREIEREGLPARVKKLENLFEKRTDMKLNFETTDVSKIMQEFQSQGLNAPTLRCIRRKTPLPTTVKTETSILDMEEDINTERLKKLAPSMLEIASSIYDGNTNDTMSIRSKSRSNTGSRMFEGGKIKSMTKLTLPKMNGTLTDLGENSQDTESNRYLFSSSPGHSRMETCPSYPVIMIEDGGDLSNQIENSSVTERLRGKEEKRSCGLETIREIARGGKENKENILRGELRNSGNLSSARINKSGESTLKQKIEIQRAKFKDVSQEKKASVSMKQRSFKNGRKDLWIAPKKRDNVGGLLKENMKGV